MKPATSSEWSMLTLHFIRMEQEAMRFGMFETARAINNAKNIAGVERAEQLGDTAARKYHQRRNKPTKGVGR